MASMDLERSVRIVHLALLVLMFFRGWGGMSIVDRLCLYAVSDAKFAKFKKGARLFPIIAARIL